MDKNIKKSSKADVYIITNCTPTGNYTPSTANTFEEAKEWMGKCTANNIRSAFEIKCDKLWEITDLEVLEWAENNIECLLCDTRTEIYYGDDTYNIMQIFKI